MIYGGVNVYTIKDEIEITPDLVQAFAGYDYVDYLQILFPSPSTLWLRVYPISIPYISCPRYRGAPINDIPVNFAVQTDAPEGGFRDITALSTLEPYTSFTRPEGLGDGWVEFGYLVHWYHMMPGSGTCVPIWASFHNNNWFWDEFPGNAWYSPWASRSFPVRIKPDEDYDSALAITADQMSAERQTTIHVYYSRTCDNVLLPQVPVQIYYKRTDDTWGLGPYAHTDWYGNADITWTVPEDIGDSFTVSASAPGGYGFFCYQCPYDHHDANTNIPH